MKTRNVVVGNPARLESKLATLRQHGASTLHVIADFDRTLTHPER